MMLTITAMVANGILGRLMHDEDGPKLAQRFYEALFVKETLDLDDIAYALDDAVQSLRRQGVPAERWALFMHMGG
jgi:hypothetical protein